MAKRTGGARPDPGRIPVGRLVKGWRGPDGALLRLARPGDAARMAQLLALAGVQLDARMAEAIDQEWMGGALVGAVRDGHETLSRTLTAGAIDGVMPDTILRLTLPLVAEASGDLVGALLAMPPAKLMQVLSQGGKDPMQVLVMAMMIGRITGLGVDPGARRTGLGGELLRLGRRFYRHLQFPIVYGQFRQGSGLEAFYKGEGFTVLDPGQPLDLQGLLGYPARIHPDSGERLFVDWQH